MPWVVHSIKEYFKHEPTFSSDAHKWRPNVGENNKPAQVYLAVERTDNIDHWAQLYLARTLTLSAGRSRHTGTRMGTCKPYFHHVPEVSRLLDHSHHLSPTRARFSLTQTHTWSFDTTHLSIFFQKAVEWVKVNVLGTIDSI